MKIPSNIKAFVLTLALIVSNASYVSAQSDKDMVIAQMNYCITTLTNIVHNKSMTVLTHESDQLLNNLTMEQIIGLYEINDFRIELLDAVSRFEITEEERSAGASATKKISITPIEDELLYVFREVGKKRGEAAQRALIEMMEKML